MSHAQVLSITTALLASGGIAALTFFDVPELQAQPASRSLPAMRWLFSRGSHVFPLASLVSTVGFIYSATNASSRGLLQLYQLSHNSPKVKGFLAAAALAFSIAPFTQVMIPTNFAIIEENNKLGGTRSQEAALKARATGNPLKSRSALDSVVGTGEGSEFKDLSGPQEQTARTSTSEEDERAWQLLEKFRWLNLVRAVLMATGGVFGLYAALL
ncbi:hypothetical protein FZEAL_721 [Fusarium zealandicum]|uniref:DUF1772-domain-containing protein n=1 Tax=Fusarium zealandicum TaxID=1053134 RepID=A0A8H4UUM7_9HYPO|nr:hypothetical protein FZEAL_721 [Fusarium zealandicum]